MQRLLGSSEPGAQGLVDPGQIFDQRIAGSIALLEDRYTVDGGLFETERFELDGAFEQ